MLLMYDRPSSINHNVPTVENKNDLFFCYDILIAESHSCVDLELEQPGQECKVSWMKISQSMQKICSHFVHLYI